MYNRFRNSHCSDCTTLPNILEIDDLQQFFFIIIYEYIFTDILYYTKTKYIMLSNSSEQISLIFYFFLISRSGSPSLYMFKTQIHFTCFSN